MAKFVGALNNKWVLTLLVIFFIAVIVGFLATIFIEIQPDLKKEFENSNGVSLSLEKESGILVYYLRRNDEVIQKVVLGGGVENYKKIEALENGHILRDSNGKELISFHYEVDSNNLVIFHINRTMDKGQEVQDCFAFSDGTNWYGGPEQKLQYYPVQKLTLNDYSYLPKELDSSAIMERYWLTSKGLFLYVDDRAPLFIDQNSDKSNHLCLRAKKALPYDTYSDSFTLHYTIGITSDARTSHLEAIQRYLHKPTDIPDERMTRFPIWSTWVRYGRAINQELIINFANEIIDYGFENAQLDIDDFWETCYGSLTFDTDTFPSVQGMTDELKEMGFRTTLWIHPFINKNCEPYYSEAADKGFFVQSHNGSLDTKWWNSGENEASYLDFTNPETVTWFKQRLDLLLDQGIDSFKFDAGETSWGPDDPKLKKSDVDFSPTQMTVDFVRSLVSYGPMIEIRTGQGTQDLPVFVRMLDFDSRWDWDNGLPSLIPTLLQMNLNGYIFVLPDMIGGNRYGDDILDKELFIRWVQATALMPSIQFSVTPWDFDQETVEISRKFTKLHEEISDDIVLQFKLSISTGEPVNAPIWWVDPEDETAQTIYDEFMIGMEILVAPVIMKNERSRDIYLPIGKYVDGNDPEKTYEGPIWLNAYPVPLDVLPYFYRSRQQ